MSSSLRASSTSSVRSNSKRSARYDTRPSRCSQASVCPTTSENFIGCSHSSDDLRSQYTYASGNRSPGASQSLSATGFLLRGKSPHFVGGLSLPYKEQVLAFGLNKPLDYRW